jgi:4-amino-4-deoxy-L-arabinose transferase-like glycosyltransferase
MKGRPISRHWEAGMVLLITLLAATLRFYRLTEVPPGLHFDEGFKGITARALLEGAPPQLFFESDMGEEPIAIYLVAATLGLAGQDPWIIRLPSALIGTLTIPLAWWLGRGLFQSSSRSRQRQAAVDQLPQAAEPQSRVGENGARSMLQGQVVGLGTALVLAILYWHLSFSRIGMEPILVPFSATLAFAALAQGLNSGRWLPFALAGVALGGSLYTYKAGYFVPVVAVLFVAWAALLERGFINRHRRGLLLMALVALLVAAPIVSYFATHPANFLQRPASVALAGGENAPASPWQALAGNLPRVLGMFFLQGDANPRSNLPGRPALDPFLAILFLVGLGWAVVRSLRGRATLAMAWIWLGVMVVPTLITEHAPHFGRAVGATPAVALLCALGGRTLWQKAADPDRRWIEVAVVSLLAVGLATSGLSTVRSYFDIWAHSPDLFYAYDVGLVEVAGQINAVPTGEDVYLSPTAQDHFTLQFLVRRPFASFDGRAGLVMPPPGRAATVFVLLREDGASLPALQGIRPDGRVTWTMTDDHGRPYAAAYHLPAQAGTDAPVPVPDRPSGAVFDNAARLLGYSLDAEGVTAGDSINLILYWQALAPLGEDYTVFTHLLGGQNPETGGPLWAGHDGQPDGGHYPTGTWQPGQVVLDVHPLTVPDDAPPGEYELEAGLYLLATMARVPASDAAGNRLPGDAIRLGTIDVGE